MLIAMPLNFIVTLNLVQDLILDAQLRGDKEMLFCVLHDSLILNPISSTFNQKQEVLFVRLPLYTLTSLV